MRSRSVAPDSWPALMAVVAFALIAAAGGALSLVQHPAPRHAAGPVAALASPTPLGIPATAEPAPSTVPSAAPSRTVAPPGASPRATPRPTAGSPIPKPTPTAVHPLSSPAAPQCDPGTLTLSAAPDQASYPPGSSVTILLTITNHGTADCVVAGGGSSDPAIVVRDANGTAVYYSNPPGGLPNTGGPTEPLPAGQSRTQSFSWDCVEHTYSGASSSTPAPAGGYTVDATWTPAGPAHTTFTITRGSDSIPFRLGLRGDNRIAKDRGRGHLGCRLNLPRRQDRYLPVTPPRRALGVKGLSRLCPAGEAFGIFMAPRTGGEGSQEDRCRPRRRPR